MRVTRPSMGNCCAGSSAAIRAVHGSAAAIRIPTQSPLRVPTQSLLTATLESLRTAHRQDPRLRFGLHVKDHPCKVVKVYDGDSLTLAFDHPMLVAGGESEWLTCFHNCRVRGIDTPEMRGGTEETRRMAKEGGDRLRDLLLNEIMCVDAFGGDKFGRPLVSLKAHPSLTSDRVRKQLGALTVEQWALANLPGCVAYDGGTKSQPVSSTEPRD